MAQWIIEAGTESAQDLIALIDALGVNAEEEISILKASDTESLIYTPSDMGIKEAIQQLSDGTVSSFKLQSPAADFDWTLFYRPQFGGDGVPWWSLVVEYRKRRNADDAYERLLRVSEAELVIQSQEESLGIAVSCRQIDDFPWADERLLRAAVRDTSGRMVQRSGSMQPSTPRATKNG